MLAFLSSPPQVPFQPSPSSVRNRGPTLLSGVQFVLIGITRRRYDLLQLARRVPGSSR